MSVHTVQFSELSRASKSVAAAADLGPVLITRRDGEPLILQRKSDVDRHLEGVELAVSISAAAVADGSERFATRLEGPFPWIAFLSHDEREQCADELLQTIRACASVLEFRPLVVTLSAWRSTADAHARGLTSDADLDWLPEPVPVERPAI